LPWLFLSIKIGARLGPGVRLGTAFPLGPGVPLTVLVWNGELDSVGVRVRSGVLVVVGLLVCVRLGIGVWVRQSAKYVSRALKRQSTVAKITELVLFSAGKSNTQLLNVGLLVAPE
jgi:hypothetical protein